MKRPYTMDEPVLYTHKWSMTKYPKLLLVIYIFLFTTTIKFSVSQPSEDTCILNLNFSSSSQNSSCKVGACWGGFLHKDCSGIAFQGYLYALGQRANQTGKIYLNLNELKNCMTALKSFEGDILGCGIEKLTSGAGGCSDYSVANVMHQMGNNFRSLKENCERVSFDGKSNHSCDSCVRSWEEIKGKHSNNDPSGDVESDYICRFAVLVSLTSTRIEDETWFQAVNGCLGNRDENNDNQPAKSTKKNKISPGLLALIGGVIGIAVIVVIAICILRKRCFGSKAQSVKDVSTDVLLETPDCLKIPIKDVYSATNNLSALNFIGEGTAGKVYKGILSNNQHVAVKHIINDGFVETFFREVTSLLHIRHTNLVALLGFCKAKDECFLVYELCPNGNLSEWLFGKDKVLSWIQRLEIAIDSAQGLWFLHSYPEGCIVHRDIKPTNILLGVNFEAKLSDFGLSKVIDQGESFVSSEVRGTFGYVDPEYQNNHHVNSSGDVYSFGIVLLQILSGKKVINMNLKNPMSLDKMAKVLTRAGSTVEFADPRLDGEYSADAFELTLKLALSCTGLKRERPTMEQVVVQLGKAHDMSTKAKASTPQASPSRPSTPERRSF